MLNKFILSILLLCGASIAYAEPGYRVCVATSLSDLSRGLAVKVAKDNKDDTCGKKTNFMSSYYGNAYPGQKVMYVGRLKTCEDFTQNYLSGKGDLCKSMAVNKIYKYTVAKRDANASVNFWHD